MRKFTSAVLFLASLLALWGAVVHSETATPPGFVAGSVTLKPCRVEGVQEELRCGVSNVFENRHTRKGRKLPLKIVLFPAHQPHPDRGPVFYMAGGPGESATELAALVKTWGDAEEQDVVLVDERGTGDGNRLDCPSRNSDSDLEAYLNGPFDPVSARSCGDQLKKERDLSQYTTPNFADDIDEIRAAMGYDKININSGSFGTYAAQIYMRRHPEHVRTAYLASLVVLENRVPLYHAESAQLGLDQLFKDCEQDAVCYATYSRLREDFATIMAKLREHPIPAFVHHPVTGARTEIDLTERAFADCVRVMMYRTPRDVPFLIEKAVAGDFGPFAEAGLKANRGIYQGGGMGLHYCITCNEFVSRIKPDEVEPATRGSYLGSWRVRDQMAACKKWPKTDLPENYFEPFRLETPIVLVSGSEDSASPPKWGEKAKSFMPNAIHLVVSGCAHTPENSCTKSIRHQLFRTGTTHALDDSCVSKTKPPAFKLP